MTIVLDPGHGGTGTAGSGAVYQPFVEKNINYQVAALVQSELEAEGVTTYLTRSSDMGSGLEERAEYASSVGADLLISIHFNSSGPHDKFGSEVWTSLYSPYYNTGYSLGSNILRHLGSLGFANKGVKTRLGNSGDYYGIIRHGVARGIPTVIIEHCFIDHPFDRILLQEKGLDELAHADAQGIMDYINSVDGAGTQLKKPEPIIFKVGAYSLYKAGDGIVEEEPQREQFADDSGVILSRAHSTNGDDVSVKNMGKDQTPRKRRGEPGVRHDASGNIIYTDPMGVSDVFSESEWEQLLSVWEHTDDAESYLITTPVDDLNSLLGR